MGFETDKGALGRIVVQVRRCPEIIRTGAAVR